MTTPSPEVFEKLASFYLGRHYDLSAGEMTDDLLMYDAKDLCTHAMCVGMTGSGKTGLCVSLLEEAAIDGIPAICVDPKGDLANLLLTFPELRPEDFKQWLEEGEAKRKGVSLDELAEKTATMWREGLASWGQTPERIRKLKDSVDVAIYTPGSNIGLPLTVLKSFDAPPPEARDDAELVGDRVTGSVSGLLTLMGINADPMTSPEHILLSSILAPPMEARKKRWHRSIDSFDPDTTDQAHRRGRSRFVHVGQRPRQIGDEAEQSAGVTGVCVVVGRAKHCRSNVCCTHPRANRA